MHRKQRGPSGSRTNKQGKGRKESGEDRTLWGGQIWINADIWKWQRKFHSLVYPMWANRLYPRTKTAQSYSNRCILAAVWIHGELRIIKQIYVYNQLTMSNISRPLSREMFIFSPKRCWHIWLAAFKITRWPGTGMHAPSPRIQKSEAGGSLV